MDEVAATALTRRRWDSLLPLGGFVVEEQHYPLPSLQDGPSSDNKSLSKRMVYSGFHPLELARRFGDGIDCARAPERKVLSFGKLPFGNERIKGNSPLRAVWMTVDLRLGRSHTPPRRQVAICELTTQ